MASVKFISELYRGIDDEMKAMTKHPQARLWFSAMVTLGLLLAFEGGTTVLCTALTRIFP